MGATMSSSAAAPAAPATRYYFCHRCFLTTALAAGAPCPICDGAFVEEIDIPPYEAPHPNPNHGLFLTTGRLSTSPASFVLRCRADADAFFLSEISPLHHLRLPPTGHLPNRLAFLEGRINYLLPRIGRGACIYVVLAGVLPTPYGDCSNLQIARLAHWINRFGHNLDTFITLGDGWTVAALRDVEIDAGPQGGQSCAVCQETLAVGTVAMRFPCTAHVYHRNCIVRWLQLQHTCPVCRFSLLTEEEIGPSHTVFRVVIAPRPLGLDLNWNIDVLEENVRGYPEIPLYQWA